MIEAEREGLVRAIREAPEGDNTARLIYADWLDDHGDAERAGLIRFCVASECQVSYSGSRPESGLSPYVAAKGGWPAIPDPTKSGALIFDSGLVDGARIQHEDFVARVAAQLSSEPVGTIQVNCRAAGASLARLSSAVRGGSFRSLGLHELISAAPGSPAELGCRRLELANCSLTAGESLPCCPRVEHLDIESSAIAAGVWVRWLTDLESPLRSLGLFWKADGVEALAPALGELEKLELGIGIRAAELLIALPLRRLTELRLTCDAPAEWGERVEMLGRHGVLGRLESLGISLQHGLPFSGEFLCDLRRSVSKLKRLSLRGYGSWGGDASTFAPDAWAGLETLDLCVSDGGAVASLARSPLLARLEALSVYLPDESSAATLLQSLPDSGRLRRLVLDGEGVLARLCAAADACPGFAGVAHLDISLGRGDEATRVFERLGRSRHLSGLQTLVLRGRLTPDALVAVREIWGPRCNAYWQADAAFA